VILAVQKGIKRRKREVKKRKKERNSYKKIAK